MNTTDNQEPEVMEAEPDFAAEIYEQEAINAKRGSFIFWFVVGVFVVAFACFGITKLWIAN